MPTLDTARNYPVPPGPLAVGNPGGGDTDPGVYYPTWSAVAPALPYELTPRPVGGGMYKPLGARAMAAGKTLPSDLVYQPQIRVRTGAAQGRVTTAPKPQMRWVRQGG